MIIAVDAEADPELSCSSLLNSRRYARIDLGVRIILPWEQIRERYHETSEEIDPHTPKEAVRHRGPHCAIGRVLYEDGSYGILLYFQVFDVGRREGLPDRFKKRYPDFPHENTSDQFFTEEQFEVYRALGYHVVEGYFAHSDKISFLKDGHRAWPNITAPQGPKSATLWDGHERPRSFGSSRDTHSDGAGRDLQAGNWRLCDSIHNRRSNGNAMAGETKALAQFAAALRYEDIPAPAVAIAKACIVDTVGVVLFGSTMPWSRIVTDYVHHIGDGSSTVLGPGFRSASAPGAAFANGAFAHAFEFDNLRQPSTGVHPGATVLTGALAAAEEAKVSGKDLITAFVAGLECMFRFALAAKSSSEKLGFHAPGITGVFGSAVAASKIMKLARPRRRRWPWASAARSARACWRS